LTGGCGGQNGNPGGEIVRRTREKTKKKKKQKKNDRGPPRGEKANIRTRVGSGDPQSATHQVATARANVKGSSLKKGGIETRRVLPYREFREKKFPERQSKNP